MKTEEKKNRSGVGNRWRREEDSLWRWEVAGEEKKIRSGVKKSLEKRRRIALALRSRWRREEESLWRRKSLEKRRRFALALRSC